MKSFSLDIDLLRTFVAVAETKSFTLAGVRLHKTQSAISVKIKKLEEQIGDRLLERSSPVCPTPLGVRCLGIAQRLICAHEDAFMQLSRDSGTNKVSVGTSETYAASILSPALKAFQSNNPKLEIDIRCGHSWDILDAQSKDNIDLVIATRSPRHVGVTLKRLPLIWVCNADSTAYCDEHLPLALFPERCLYRQAAIEALLRVGRSWSIAYTSSHHDGLIAAITTGNAVTAMIDSAIPAHFRRLDRSTGLPELPMIDVALYKASNISPVAKELGMAIEAHYLGDPSSITRIGKLRHTR